MRKNKIHAHIIDTYIEKTAITVLEYGRIRFSKPRVEKAGGWSTLQFARHPRVERIYSLDTNPETIGVCEKVIPQRYWEKIVYKQYLSELDLTADQIDFLFLDANNDPKQNFDLYWQTLPFLADDAWVLLDDVFSREGRKGEILLPYWRGKGYRIVKTPPMVATDRSTTNGD